MPVFQGSDIIAEVRKDEGMDRNIGGTWHTDQVFRTNPSWGTMLDAGRGHLLDAPHLTLVPGLAIAILVLGLNFVGDGLRDRLSPKG